jgi:hypothetical protein
LKKRASALAICSRESAWLPCLLASGADGFQVVIALPELDPSFTDKQVVLAFLQEGKPLSASDGPFRIVIPDEKRMSRWVKQVATLKIVDAH